MVTNLTRKCVQFLEYLLSAETAAQLLDQSILFEEEELKQTILKKIQANASAVLSSEDFSEISHQALHKVLQLNLKITKELEVFEAAMKWAEHKCQALNQPTEGHNQRKVLGDCIYLIRFPTMSLDEFTEVVAPTQVLSESEGYQLMLYISAKNGKATLLSTCHSAQSHAISRHNQLHHQQHSPSLTQLHASSSYQVRISCVT
jgi:BTB/POZ domain-containing protein 1/2